MLMQVSLFLAMCLFVLGKWFGAQEEAKRGGVYTPAHPVDVEALRGIDMERVHAELFPAWIVARQEAAGDAELAALRDAVRADPNLVDLLEDMSAHARGDDIDALLHAVWSWNQHLDAQGVGWRMDAGLHPTVGGRVFYLKTYRVVFDGQARVDPREHRLRVLRRADNLGVIEAYLGHTPAGEDGSLVVADRLAGFALDSIWPLLEPGLDDRHAVPRGRFGPAVRAVVAAALSEDEARALLLTASDRYYIQETVTRIHARHSCGSRLLIREVPFNGLDSADLRRIRRAVDLTEREPCPEATSQEALMLSIRSDHLQSVAGIEPGLERLAALITRAIAIHELQHASDAERDLVCLACPQDLSEVGVLELSAYLASFSDADTGVLAALQACTLPLDELPARGPAIRYLSEALGGLCRNGPPPDLADRAQALERELFGRSGGVVLPDSFPDRIGVRTRRTAQADGWSRSPHPPAP